MQHKEMVTKIAEETQLKKVDVEAVLQKYQEVIVDQIKSGEKVNSRGFGTFLSHTTKARVGRNVKTGEAIPIPELKRVKFKPSAEFKESLNK